MTTKRSVKNCFTTNIQHNKGSNSASEETNAVKQNYPAVCLLVVSLWEYIVANFLHIYFVPSLRAISHMCCFTESVLENRFVWNKFNVWKSNKQWNWCRFSIVSMCLWLITIRPKLKKEIEIKLFYTIGTCALLQTKLKKIRYVSKDATIKAL